jgi:hypothetical protein
MLNGGKFSAGCVEDEPEFGNPTDKGLAGEQDNSQGLGLAGD